MNKEKVAIVTGGNKGIGKAIAIALAKEGFKIIIVYSSSEEAALKVQEEINTFGVESSTIRLDVSNYDQAVEVMDKAFDIYGRVDVLINNAGITKDQLLLRMTEKEFDDVINVNLKGSFNCIKGISKKMLKQRSGKIINISSVVGVTGNIGQSNYAASKAGVIGMTKSLAKEFARRNIQVNAIAPGFIKTAMTEKLSDNVREAMLNNIPANKFGDPNDVANLAVFLASNKADYITGQVIAVDGGLTY